MQLLLLHNSDGSVYYATEDKEACGKDFRATVGEKSVTLLTDIVASEGWSDDTTETFTVPWSTVIGIFKHRLARCCNEMVPPFHFYYRMGK